MSAIPGFYTVHEAAAVLQRSHSQVCRYIRNGQLSARRIGRELLIGYDDVKNFTPPPIGNPLLLSRSHKSN
jgi:excisionase family DNA binding protein